MSLKQWGIKMNKTLSTNWFKRQRKNWWQPHKNSKYKLKVMSRVKNFLPFKTWHFLPENLQPVFIVTSFAPLASCQIRPTFLLYLSKPSYSFETLLLYEIFFHFLPWSLTLIMNLLYSRDLFLCVFLGLILILLYFIRGRLWKHILPFQLKCLRLSWNIWEIRQVEKSEESQWLSLIWSKRVSWKWTKCCLCISVQSQENKPTVLMSVLLA